MLWHGNWDWCGPCGASHVDLRPRATQATSRFQAGRPVFDRNCTDTTVFDGVLLRRPDGLKESSSHLDHSASHQIGRYRSLASSGPLARLTHHADLSAPGISTHRSPSQRKSANRSSATKHWSSHCAPWTVIWRINRMCGKKCDSLSWDAHYHGWTHPGWDRHNLQCRVLFQLHSSSIKS